VRGPPPPLAPPPAESGYVRPLPPPRATAPPHRSTNRPPVRLSDTGRPTPSNILPATDSPPPHRRGAAAATTAAAVVAEGASGGGGVCAQRLPLGRARAHAVRATTPPRRQFVCAERQGDRRLRRSSVGRPAARRSPLGAARGDARPARPVGWERHLAPPPPPPSAWRGRSCGGGRAAVCALLPARRGLAGALTWAAPACGWRCTARLFTATPPPPPRAHS